MDSQHLNYPPMAEESSPYEAEPLTGTKETENTSYLPSKPSCNWDRCMRSGLTSQTNAGEEKETAAGAAGTTATHSGEAVGKNKD